MAKTKKEGVADEPRTGYSYDPPIDPTPGGTVRVKTRSGKMVEVPEGTRSLAEIVGAAPTGSAPATTTSTTSTTPGGKASTGPGGEPKA